MNLTPNYSIPLNCKTNPMVMFPASDIKGDIILEIGPGYGDFLFYLANKNPDKAIYGIEIKGKRFDYLVKKKTSINLPNVKLILADAFDAIPHLFKNNSISSIHINFPDPWPKRKHAKYRLMQNEFIELIIAKLKKSGTLYFTTDHKDYSDEVYKRIGNYSRLNPVYNGIQTESPESYPTFFFQKWKKMGKTIYYQKYAKSSKQ